MIIFLKRAESLVEDQCEGLLRKKTEIVCMGKFTSSKQHPRDDSWGIDMAQQISVGDVNQSMNHTLGSRRRKVTCDTFRYSTLCFSNFFYCVY
mmetsp:Transcript_9536/g.20627  ORF Transcript_9536/g.20627 Transcript_9536/m.20627 type:complete len:93 (+) Transcript_9536:185-463(+)